MNELIKTATPFATYKKTLQKTPWIYCIFLFLICIGCILANLIASKDPAYMDLRNSNTAPNSEFLFGTDSMGRDIFSMIWYGGRLSLFIGIFSALISTFLGIIIGTISGSASPFLDRLIMRATEIFLSIPSLLIITFLQAILGSPNVLSISLVIGVSSWTEIAKVVRTEVKQLRNSEYILAARCMGGGFFYLLFRHLIPNFLSSVMFMSVMNIRGAIIAESTLSFMGLGLPLEMISWGSMLSLSENALLSGSWWVILIPGLFLLTTLLCITELGNYLRMRNK